MQGFLEKIFQFLLPSQCRLCEAFLGEEEEGICPGCLSKIRWIEPPFCTVCGTPFLSADVENHPCGECLKKSKYFTAARAVGYYTGPLQEAIHLWKYEGKLTLTPLFGEWMAKAFQHHGSPESFDLLVPVPLYVKRLRQRGVNQALLLVRELSRHTGIPTRKRLLQKTRPTVPQVQLTGAERAKAVKGTFRVRRESDAEGKSILLVDDVYTTGATVNECARVLMASGAARVEVLTLARAVKLW